MFAPLILSVLMPLNPALFLRELAGWFMAGLARTLRDPGTRDWIANDRSGLKDILRSLLFIEDMIATLVHLRVRQILGLKKRKRGRRMPLYRAGHARSLEEIERRFHRALARFADIERLAKTRAARIRRLLDPSARQLERVHPPVEQPPSTTTTIFPGVRQKSSTAI